MTTCWRGYDEIVSFDKIPINGRFASTQTGQCYRRIDSDGNTVRLKDDRTTDIEEIFLDTTLVYKTDRTVVELY